jgi:hypothetical protein
LDTGVLDTGGLDTDVLKTSVLETDVLESNVLSELQTSPEYFQITEVKNVRSLAREDFRDNNLKGVFGTMVRKWQARNKTLKEVIELGWAKNDLEKNQAIHSLYSDKRWEHIRTIAYLSNPRYHLYLRTWLSDDYFNSQESEDRKDMAKLSSDKYDNTKEVIEEFIKAVRSYFNELQTYWDEAEQFKRFDKYYNDTQLGKILRAIKSVTFSAAEIKAVNAQETGDFTIKTIHGLKDKEKGIINKVTENEEYLGLGQHGVDARDEAIGWARTKGIDIKITPDPRFAPQTAIYLTAAYFGYILEVHLLKYLPKPIPSGIELKKLVFASYNWRHGKVISAIKKLNTQGKSYSWENINQPPTPEETRIYIQRVTLRLSKR